MVNIDTKNLLLFTLVLAIFATFFTYVFPATNSYFSIYAATGECPGKKKCCDGSCREYGDDCGSCCECGKDSLGHCNICDDPDDPDPTDTPTPTPTPVTCVVNGRKLIESGAGNLSDVNGASIRHGNGTIITNANPFSYIVGVGDNTITSDNISGYVMFNTSCWNSTSCHTNSDSSRLNSTAKTFTCPTSGGTFDISFHYIKSLGCPDQSQLSTSCSTDAQGMLYASSRWPYVPNAGKYVYRANAHPVSRWYYYEEGDRRVGDIPDVSAFAGGWNYANIQVTPAMAYTFSVQPGYAWEVDGNGGYYSSADCPGATFTCDNPPTATPTPTNLPTPTLAPVFSASCIPATSSSNVKLRTVYPGTSQRYKLNFDNLNNGWNGCLSGAYPGDKCYDTDAFEQYDSFSFRVPIHDSFFVWGASYFMNYQTLDSFGNLGPLQYGPNFNCCPEFAKPATVLIDVNQDRVEWTGVRFGTAHIRINDLTSDGSAYAPYFNNNGCHNFAGTSTLAGAPRTGDACYDFYQSVTSGGTKRETYYNFDPTHSYNIWLHETTGTAWGQMGLCFPSYSNATSATYYAPPPPTNTPTTIPTNTPVPPLPCPVRKDYFCQPSLNANSMKMLLSWSPVSGSSDYLVRVNKYPYSDWQNTSGGDFALQNGASTTYSFDTRWGDRYVYSSQPIRTGESDPYPAPICDSSEMSCCPTLSAPSVLDVNLWTDYIAFTKSSPTSTYFVRINDLSNGTSFDYGSCSEFAGAYTAPAGTKTTGDACYDFIAPPLTDGRPTISGLYHFNTSHAYRIWVHSALGSYSGQYACMQYSPAIAKDLGAVATNTPTVTSTPTPTPTLAPVCQTITDPSLPKTSTVANPTINANFNVLFGGVITDINVKNITASAIDTQMTMTLSNPSSQVQYLSNLYGSGVSTPNNISFDDASTLVVTSPSSWNANYVINPWGNLGGYNGQRTNGVWTFTGTRAGGRSGPPPWTLSSAALEICYIPDAPPTSTPTPTATATPTPTNPVLSGINVNGAYIQRTGPVNRLASVDLPLKKDNTIVIAYRAPPPPPINCKGFTCTPATYGGVEFSCTISFPAGCAHIPGSDYDITSSLGSTLYSNITSTLIGPSLPSTNNFNMAFPYTGDAWIRLKDASLTRSIAGTFTNNVPFIIDEYLAGTSIQGNIGTNSDNEDTLDKGVMDESLPGSSGFVPNIANFDISPLMVGSPVNGFSLPSGYVMNSVFLGSGEGSLEYNIGKLPNVRAAENVTGGGVVTLNPNVLSILTSSPIVTGIGAATPDAPYVLISYNTSTQTLSDITISGNTTGGGALLVVANNISIGKDVSELNGIFIAKGTMSFLNDSTTGVGSPIKIRGNIIAGGGLASKRVRADKDHARPSMFMVYDYNMYQILMPVMGIVGVK